MDCFIVNNEKYYGIPADNLECWRSLDRVETQLPQASSCDEVLVENGKMLNSEMMYHKYNRISYCDGDRFFRPLTQLVYR